MEIDKNILLRVADKASENVSRALSKLSKENVDVSSTAAEVASLESVSESLTPSDSHAIITYAQMISGIAGVSLLVIPREEALELVDLLNNQPIGTTGVFLDIDRSAIKETLNILSNSYLTVLSKELGSDFIMSSPNMIPTASVQSILKKINRQEHVDRVVFFKTTLKVSRQQIRAQLYIIFSEKLFNLFKNV